MSKLFCVFTRASGLRRTGVAAGILMSALALLPVTDALAALPIPTACQEDLHGANDQPGQKDITLFCAEDGDGAPFEYNTIVNWDEVSLPGGNTADVCSLYDWNDNGFVDFAVCVTLEGDFDNVAVLSHVRLFICDDSKADRCSSASLIPAPYNTVCEVSQKQTDPFSPAIIDGPGDAYPNDTEMLCSVDLDEFGPLGASAVLIDACSYPSESPNSDPSDCVALKQCVANDECDDGNVCTQDRCGAGGHCVHKPRNGNVACDDGLYCNGDDACNRSGLCEPGVTPRDCDDDVTCTVDSCDEVNDTCDHEARNSLCANADYCDGVETCDPLDDCQPGTPPNCSDNVGCTLDACNEATDSCDHTVSDDACDDGQYCDGAETCDAELGCQPGIGPDCNDGVTCTTDACNEARDTCTNVPNNGACSDGQWCTGTETCDAVNGCQPGTPPNCVDDVPCTGDSCNEAADRCDHDPDSGQCQDGEFCTGVEVCDPVDGCGPGPDPCPDDLCSEDLDQCVQCLVDGDCNDGLFCDGVETCNVSTGTCVPGTPPNCNDGVACTTDSCSEAQDQCVNAPNDGACSDGQFCTGAETCDPVDGCQPGTPPDCADDVACTVDSCNEAANQCDHAPDGGQCQDGEFCTGVEVCDVEDGCGPGPDPCPNDLCSENLDQCVQCLTDGDCNNGQFCDGEETCNAAIGACLPGTPPNCNDGFGCTSDTCNEATNVCDHAPSDAACGDGQFCNGSEVCVVGEGCQAGAAPDCDDAVTCTVDACDEVGDQCTHTGNDSACSNGLFCDGEEICDLLDGCLAGTAPECGDEFECTGDFCNEGLDRCDHSPNNAACQDELFCNGSEVCDVDQGCIAGTPPTCSDAFVCSADTCIEDTDTCAHDFATCVCGDNEITGVEVCDPPAMSGSFEDCDNDIDDDLDGEIDCRDKDCKPGARAPICDEGCELDQVCTKFIRDPATIVFNREAIGLDEFYVHGRIGLSGNPDPLTEGMTIKVSNPYTTVFEAGLGFGDMLGRTGGRNFIFRDEEAKLLGQSSRAGGISMARLKFRFMKGRPYLVFTIRAYGDLLAADHWLMTTELRVGAEVGFLTSEWKAARNGWKLHQVDF